MDLYREEITYILLPSTHSSPKLLEFPLRQPSFSLVDGLDGEERTVLERQRKSRKKLREGSAFSIDTTRWSVGKCGKRGSEREAGTYELNTTSAGGGKESELVGIAISSP